MPKLVTVALCAVLTALTVGLEPASASSLPQQAE
jgi:hypothetical protein